MTVTGQVSYEMTDNLKHNLQSQDRRIAKTRSALWEALLALLQSESWDQINVRMICERANVARSSFYLHFRNKHELLDFGFVVGMEETRKQVRFQEAGKPYGTIVWLVAHVDSSRDFFKKTRIENGPIQRRFQETVQALFIEEMHLRELRVPETTVTFIIGGVFAVLADWVTSLSDKEPAKVVSRLQELTDKVVKRL